MYQGMTALLVRALRVDSRSTRVFVVYFLMQLSTLASLYKAQAMQNYTGAPGKDLFSSTVWMNGFAILLVSCTYFASAITEEKEETTLGLLKMAGIGPLTLILGKGLPRLMHVLIILAMQIPFALLAITLGGIRFNQILAGNMTLLAFAIMGFGLAMFASVACRTSRGANSLSLFFMILVLSASALFTVLKFLAVQLFSVRLPEFTESISAFLSSISPIGRVETVLLTSYSGEVFHMQQIVHCGLGLVGIVGSVLIFERATRNMVPVAPLRTKSSRKRETIFRPSRPWKNALAWKDFSFGRMCGRGGLIGRLLFYPFLTLGFVALGSINSGFDIQAFFWTLMIVSLVGALLEIVGIFGRFLKTEIQENTWSTLFMMPVSLRRIVWSKFLGQFALAVPALIWAAVGCSGVFSVSDVVKSIAWTFEEPVFYAYAPAIPLSFALFVALTTYLSLSMRWGAAVVAYLVMQFAGNFVGLLLMGLSMILPMPGIFIVGYVLAIACILGLVHLTRKKLNTIAAK